ncbi:MAG: DUF1062 domain-containing protein [Eubacteriales bacterium]|nr:DUF1062 domain-containing protein [Eubacteriales bacterium]
MQTLRWTLRVLSLPRFTKTCPHCGGQYYENSGRFRVNANGKRLDIWLVCRCEHCKSIWNLSVFERIDRAALCQADYMGYLENSESLVLRHVFDPAFCAKNRAVLDPGSLDYAVSGVLPRAGEAARVEAACAYALPIPAAGVIGRTLGLSLSGVRRLCESGLLTLPGDPRNIKANTGFSFTLQEGWHG